MNLTERARVIATDTGKEVLRTELRPAGPPLTCGAAGAYSPLFTGFLALADQRGPA
jgi:hypothetical protein